MYKEHWKESSFATRWIERLTRVFSNSDYFTLQVMWREDENRFAALQYSPLLLSNGMRTGFETLRSMHNRTAASFNRGKSQPRTPSLSR